MISTIRRGSRPQQDEVNRLPRVDVGGRYLSQYNPALALEIIERLAEGETLNAICKGQEGMPAPKTFRRWMVNNPELAKAYDVAMRLSAASLEEEALDGARAIAREPRTGTHVRAMEVKLGQLKWSMERRDPARFGQKTQVNIKVPVQIITPLDLNLPAGPTIQDIYTINANVAKPVEAIETPDQGQLVPEKRIPIGGRRKVKLTPPSGVKDETPFGKAMRRAIDEARAIRQAGGEGSHREEQGGSRSDDGGGSGEAGHGYEEAAPEPRQGDEGREETEGDVGASNGP